MCCGISNDQKKIVAGQNQQRNHTPLATVV